MNFSIENIFRFLKDILLKFLAFNNNRNYIEINIKKEYKEEIYVKIFIAF